MQHIVRLPSNHPYLDLKTKLIKACKLNKNDCLDFLFNKTDIGNHKLTEMLNKMHLLVEAYNVTNTQINAVLQKLFLDKLPAQARTILAGSLETNLDSLALRTNEIMAALSQNTDAFHSTSNQ